MLPKVLFGRAFSAPINGRMTAAPDRRDVPDPVGTEDSCAGGTRHSPGAGSLWFLGVKF